MSLEDSRHSNLSGNDNRLDQLLSQLLDSTLSPEEHEELAGLVVDNDQDLERFVDHVMLDTLIQEEIGPESIVELVDLMQGEPVANLRSESVVVPWRQRTQRNAFAGFVTLAAFVFLAFTLFRGGDAGFANAATIIRAAINTVGQNIERIYVVEVTKGDAISPEIARTARIVTQGDRFWVEMNRGKQRWTWGRMADDSVWLALGPRHAILLSSDEMGDPLKHIVDIFSLRTEELLQDVLSNCELDYSQPDEVTHRIVAVPKSGYRHRRRLQRAVLDVDMETKAVRKLTIERQFADGHTSTQTFTLVDTRASDDSLFRPAGHLSGDTQIFDHSSSPDRRAEILHDIFGAAATGWLRTSN